MTTKGIRDPHRYLAAQFLNLPEESITIDLRKMVKEVTFQVLTQTQEVSPLVFAHAFMSRMKDSSRFNAAAINTIAGVLEMLHYGIDKQHGWLSESGYHMPLGVYDHFKGGVYMVDRVLRWAEDGEPVVSYLSLTEGSWHGRRCSEWAEVVQWPDGKFRSRFVYRGPDLRTAAPSFKVAGGTRVSEVPFTALSMFPPPSVK